MQRWKPVQFFQRKMIKIIKFYFELKSINNLSNFMFFDTIKTMIINVKSFSVELISNSSRRIFSKFIFSSTVVYCFGQWFMVSWKLARHEMTIHFDNIAGKNSLRHKILFLVVSFILINRMQRPCTLFIFRSPGDAPLNSTRANWYDCMEFISNYWTRISGYIIWA